MTQNKTKSIEYKEAHGEMLTHSNVEPKTKRPKPQIIQFKQQDKK